MGRGDLVGRLRRDPLARAVRPDKVTLAALAATFELYRTGLATAEIPVWRMIAASPEALRRRAETVAASIADSRVETQRMESTVGGGSLPGETLPSFGLALAVQSANRVLGRLRTGEPAVVARIADGRVLLDLRTVEPNHDPALVAAVRAAISAS